MNEKSSRQLWKRVKRRLDFELPDWRDRIVNLQQVPAIEAREQGKRWTDEGTLGIPSRSSIMQSGCCALRAAST